MSLQDEGLGDIRVKKGPSLVVFEGQGKPCNLPVNK